MFMDARWLVTPKEGDRYPLGPPSICTVRLSVRSPPFQGGKMGSIPIRCAKFYAGVLLGEDSAFQADGKGSNPFARSNLSRVRIAAIAAASKSAGSYPRGFESLTLGQY